MILTGANQGGAGRGVACLLSLLAGGWLGGAWAQERTVPHRVADAPERVVITASRLNLTGRAATASQGSITRKELELRPVYRVGQLLESVPGLVVTVHSGEGKANQYLLRGFNLDHGTDFASFVDGMPVNRPTNAHGQGYSDLNFLIPQMFAGLDFTKGPFFAAVGDFGAVGAARLRLLNDLPAQLVVSAGTLGDADAMAGGTYHVDGANRLYGAIDIGHLDGPWRPANNFHKVNLASRFSHGTDADGYSVTAMYHTSQGRLTTDQPVAALDDGLIGRYGTLDPTDGSASERLSVSGGYGVSGGGWQVRSNVYAIHSRMTLWNDFTHYLDDPVNGDQEQQDEDRTTLGGAATYTRQDTLFGLPTETAMGVQDRFDHVFIDRRHTRDRAVLGYCELEQPDGDAVPYSVGNTACNADRVRLNDLGVFAEHTTHWLPWLRTILGVREEYYSAGDRSLVTRFEGRADQSLVQPKGSIVFGPWRLTEFYVSAGRGFHSDDVRGVFGTVPTEGLAGVAGATPLMARAISEEVGLRTTLLAGLHVQLAVFAEDFASELRYNADSGEDSASAPSRRRGVELSAEYRPAPWIELNTDIAVSHARYQIGDAAAYGLAGTDIANAPTSIASVGVLVADLGPWFGGVQVRDLGPYPLIEDNSVRARGYAEVNADVGYTFSRRLKVQLSVFNLFNSSAYAAQYAYGYRLTPGGDVQSGPTFHPLEPISARLTVTGEF